MKKPKITRCDRCNGKGWRRLVVGPHIRDGMAVPGGFQRYDCLRCNGTGRKQSTAAPSQADRGEK